VASRRGRRAPPATAQPEAVRYIETSALLAALLEGDAAARKSLRARGTLVTSLLTFAEARRSLVRARHGGRLTAEQERSALRALSRLRARCTTIAVTDEILGIAGRPFPAEPIRTLDAVHLATVAAVTDAPQFATVITRDERVRSNALAAGYVVE
jgi:predicted nucleic acid-binding protein